MNPLSFPILMVTLSLAPFLPMRASVDTPAKVRRSISPSARWIAEGNQVFANFGASVATAGDVNGDGYADVIVGAPLYNNGQATEGRAFVYHGSASGLNLIPDWTAEANQVAAHLGASVSTAGDVNGDGYDDVIVGAPVYDNGQIDEGRAFVYHGSATGLSLAPAWTAESDQTSAFFGHSVGTAGDVNGDGYDDVIVGANFYDGSQTDDGRAYVYYGSASGPSLSSDWTAESNQQDARFGVSVSTAGDVNGDGYDDVIVGAYQYTNARFYEGRAFVYHGSAGGLSANTNWAAEGKQDFASFGYSVSSAGDVNGDSFDDVIVGAREFQNGQDDEGRAFVFHGSASGLSASPDWRAESNQGGAFFGASVSTAGDLEGDGYADVIVGADHYDRGQIDEGRFFVYSGSASGLSVNPDFAGESNQANSFMGQSVGTAGDVNGDGRDSLIVGAPFYDRGQSDEGIALVLP